RNRLGRSLVLDVLAQKPLSIAQVDKGRPGLLGDAHRSASASAHIASRSSSCALRFRRSSRPSSATFPLLPAEAATSTTSATSAWEFGFFVALSEPCCACCGCCAFDGGR